MSRGVTNPPLLSHHRSCGSASGGSVVKRCTYTLQQGLLRSEYCIALQSMPYRPPQLRRVIFPSTYLPHLPSIPSDSYGASVSPATLPDIPSLICDFCPSDQRFAIRLPSDSTSRWPPLPLAISFTLSGHFTNFHRLDYAHAGRTRKRCLSIHGQAPLNIYFMLIASNMTRM